MAFFRTNMRPAKFFIVALFVCTTCCSRGVIFKWDRPHIDSLPLPIKSSATCSFRQALAATMDNDQVRYSRGAENEADTVAFSDLDTDTPKMVANLGQSSLRVASRARGVVGLVNTPNAAAGTIEVYMIFTESGVVVRTAQYRLLGTPFATMEMGFCH